MTLEQMEIKKRDIEKFFRDTFDAEHAEIMIPPTVDSFEVNAVIEIRTGDKRGTFYIGQLEKMEK